MERPSRTRKAPARFEDFVNPPSTTEEVDLATEHRLDPETYDPFSAMRASLSSLGEIPMTSPMWDSHSSRSLSDTEGNSQCLSTESSSAHTPNIVTLDNGHESVCSPPLATTPTLIRPWMESSGSSGSEIQPSSTGGPFLSTPTDQALNGHHLSASVPWPFYSNMACHARPSPLTAADMQPMGEILRDIVEQLIDLRETNQCCKSRKIVSKPRFLPFSNLADIDAFEENSEADFGHLVKYLKSFSSKTRPVMSVAADLFRETIDKNTNLLLKITVSKAMPGMRPIDGTRYCSALITSMKLLRKDLDAMGKKKLLSVSTKGLKSVKVSKRRN